MQREGLEGRFFLRSKILPEEDPSGFLNRMLDYRAAHTRDQIIELLGSSSGRLAWSFPSRLDVAKALFPRALPEMDGLVHGYTRFPLFSPFLVKATRRRLYMHHRKEGYSSVAQSFGLLDRARFGICLKCVQEDLEKTKGGFAYWRRAHLIPGVAYCVVHQELLYTLCESCELGHRRNSEPVYPGPKCLCGKAVQRMVKPKRQKSEDALLAIDAMAVELMQGKCPVMVEPGLIPMHARGYLLRQAHPNFVHLLRESTGLLNQVIGGEALALLNVRGHTVERLLGRLGDGLHLINPRQNIAFVYTVFGGWPGLKEEVDLRAQDVEAYEASGQHVPKRIRVGKDTKSDLIRRFNNLDDRELKERRRAARDFIQAALKANRCLTRTELFRMRGGKTHYLFALYMDEAWFLKALPRIVLTAPRKREVSVRAAFPGLKPTGKDADFAERIYEVCDALLETNPLKRITRACLLNNSRNESIKGWAEKSPSVREALEACVDSDEEFIERRLGYVCEKVAEISILHPYALKSSYRGLSNLQIIQRIKRALTWLKKHLG